MRKLVIIAMILFIATLANAYTFDSTIDPGKLFSYEPVGVEQISPVMAIMSLKSETCEPKYVVVCMMQIGNKQVFILAYAYFDKEFNFKHYMFDGTSHYSEKALDPQTKKMILGKLRKLHGLSDAQSDNGKTDV